MAMKLGLQMYSVRDYMVNDAMKTIREVGTLGYRHLEFANMDVTKDLGVGFGTPVEELRKSFDDMGVRMIGLHFRAVDDPTYQTVNFSALLEAQKILGNEHMVLPSDYYTSNYDIKKKAAEYNRIGKLCKENGFSFSFHNHVEIGQIFDGNLALDTLMQNTDPEYVTFEVDTYWAQRAGLDPIEVIRKLGKRVILIHQKDIPMNLSTVNIFSVADPAVPLTKEEFHKFVSAEAFTEIGTGKMDIQAIINAANEYSSAEYLVLEQDYTSRDQMESLRISIRNLKKYKGLVF